MKANVGTVDRAFRILAGVALIVPAASGKLGPWAYLGAVPLLTGLFKYCPAYSLLGIDTCDSRKQEAA